MNSHKKSLNKVYIALLFDGLCVSSANVILPLLREQFHLQYDFTGLLLAFLSIGNLAAALLCGVLSTKIGMKKTAMIFIIGMMLGYGILTISGAPVLLIAGFLFIGLAKGASMNNGTVLAGNMAEDRTKSVNMINAMYALGSMLAPFIYLAASGKSFPWWMPIAVLTVAGLILWLLFFSIKDFGEKRDLEVQKCEDSDLVNCQNSQTDEKGQLKKDKQEIREDKNSKEWEFLKEKHFWLSTSLLFGQQCAEISVTGWLVTYYKDQGILSGVFSEFTVTVIWFAMLAARLFIVFVLPANKNRNSLTIMSIASLITYALMLCANNGITAILSLFLFGVSIAGVYPTAIAQASKGLSNASVGVQLPIAGIGAIAMPYITGAVAQRIGIKGGMACSLVALVWMLVFAVLTRAEDRK